MIEKDTRRYGQDAETRKMSHTVSVQEDTLVLEMDIKKQMEVVLAGREERVILQCVPLLGWNELKGRHHCRITGERGQPSARTAIFFFSTRVKFQRLLQACIPVRTTRLRMPVFSFDPSEHPPAFEK